MLTRGDGIKGDARQWLVPLAPKGRKGRKTARREVGRVCPSAWRECAGEWRRPSEEPLSRLGEGLSDMAESSSSRVSTIDVRNSMGPLVPCREGAPSYEPTIKCHCRMKTPRWISWSDDNPGCARTELDCGFFEWFDPEHTRFLKNLLFDLRNAVWRMKKESSDMQEVVGRAMEVEEHKQALEVENKVLMEELKVFQKKLVVKDELLKSMEMVVGKKCSSICCILLVLQLVLLVGMMLGALVMA
ncbi:hypothetical protein BS78_09G127500 [Paspalum vaginatum]|nr:hypothetical protein BS78_09G127500 [Paspalum vaginatum]